MTQQVVDVPTGIFTKLDKTIENLRYAVLELNSTKPTILVHINDFLPSSDVDKKHISWGKDFETHSVNVEYNYNSNFSKRELLQRISKILLDLSNEDDDLLLSKIVETDKK